MSRAQSPDRDQTLTMKLLADKLIEVSDVVHGLKIQMEDLKLNKELQNATTSRTHIPDPVEASIKTYDKAMHLIPEFDGTNVETFISHIQVAARRLTRDQHDLFLCSIIAQKLTGRAKGTIRIDLTPSLPQFLEKLRFLYGKAQNLSALEVQRDTCIQRHGETINDFINRFLQIHDEIITTLNSQNIGTTTICIQEELYQQKAIEVFRRNIKPEIGDHLYSFELDSLNQAFSKARAFEGELQLRRMRMQRNENTRRPTFQPSRPTRKECTYCRRPGHEERECRTKMFHQQRNQQQNFREGPTLRRPPNEGTSRHSHAVNLHLDQDQDYDEKLIKDQEGPTSVLQGSH